jgi:prophage tail gpP-like protein
VSELAPQLEVRVAGERVRGFRSASVTQSLDQLASQWRVEYDASYAGDPWVIEAGDPVELRVVGAGGVDELVLEGFVDDDESALDGRLLSRSIAGRSRLGDVVDCDASVREMKLRNVGVIDVANALLDGYEVTALDESGEAARWPVFKVDVGETIGSALQRAAKDRGMIVRDDAGAVVFSRAGQAATSTRLVEGGDRVLSWRYARSWRERFSEYRFLGTGRGETADDAVGRTEYILRDEAVTRTRRHTVHVWGAKGEDRAKRATLERNTRAGRSERVTLQVAGWLTDEGGIWRPNTRVSVQSETLGINATLLIVSATLESGPELHRTTLELTRPEALDAVVNYPTRARGAEWRS